MPASPMGALPRRLWPSGSPPLMGRLIAPPRARTSSLSPATRRPLNLVLPHLRARFAIPFVGTVPAIKPAAALSRSRLISVLATPGTVARDYTTLIDAHAGECRVTLVGSPRLAELAEAELCGEPVATTTCWPRSRPAFVESRSGARTDVVGARLHALSAAPAALPAPRPLAGDLDRPGAGDRAPGGAAPRRRRSPAAAPATGPPWPYSRTARRCGPRLRSPCAERGAIAAIAHEPMPPLAA